MVSNYVSLHNCNRTHFCDKAYETFDKFDFDDLVYNGYVDTEGKASCTG